jgi:3-deoxy-D-manno-octulosonate 8-phosphate phosphatase (KDO 8-P phosphatase)
MNTYEKFSQIKTMIFDVDGVFTDNGLLVTEEGHFLRIMSARDGLAIRMAREAGYRLAIITGGNSLAVEERLTHLGIHDVFLKIDDKMEVFERYLEENNLDPKTILYMGDDLLDIEVLKKVFLSTCPKDAAPEVAEVAEYISPVGGGQGCVRDVVEKVMKAQDRWPY